MQRRNLIVKRIAALVETAQVFGERAAQQRAIDFRRLLLRGSPGDDFQVVQQLATVTVRGADQRITRFIREREAAEFFLRAIEQFPKQGSRTPWRLHQNYARDILTLKYGSIEDEALEFSRAAPAAREAVEQLVA